jgi:hypothetical protein
MICHEVELREWGLVAVLLRGHEGLKLRELNIIHITSARARQK